MSGQMTRYKESLKRTPEPIMLRQIQGKMDLRGIVKYAKKKGVAVYQLTEKEKKNFMK